MTDRTTKALLLAIALGLLAGLRIAAQGGEQRLAPGDVNWPAAAGAGIGTSGVSGVQTIVVKGDPAKPGLYTLLLRAGPNLRFQAHSHQDDRVAAVLSGTWYLGYGEKFDEAGLKELPAGSFYTEPPGSNHFAMTKDESVVIQITGVGPSSTTYVNPNDDPNRRP